MQGNLNWMPGYLDLVTLEKIYHKILNHYIMKKNSKIRNFIFLKYSLVRNKFEVRWNKK